MREFYLINGNGVQFNLNTPRGFFHSPNGLGFDRTQQYLRTGDFYKAIDDYPSQKMVSGEMIFRSYADYQTFTRFIAIKPLKLIYKPLNTEYRLDCTISSFQKSEIDYQNNRLICPITFMGESKWYFLRNIVTTHPTGAGAKIYSFDYNFTYYDEHTGVMDLINDSPSDAPCILHIQGYCRNPHWSLTVNNKQIMSGEVEAEIQDGNQLVINSRDDSLEISEYTNQNVFVENLYQKADVSMENFIYIPTGTSKLMITDDALSDITAYLEILEEYDTI